MSSPERELLKNASDILKHLNYDDDLIANGVIWKIEKLLAQPELENNIVCWGSFDLGGKCVGTHDTRRLAAQIQGGNEILPLYLKQEPREPLSDEELSTLATDDLYDCTYTTTVFAYKEYARKIEKAYGIGVDDE